MLNLVRTACAVALLTPACDARPRQSPPVQLSKAPSQALTFDLQQRCADRAALLWKEQGYDIGTNQPNETGFFTNHWNTRADKCFILITRSWTTDASRKTQLIFRDVQDVLEGKVYASIAIRAERTGDGRRAVVSCRTTKQDHGSTPEACQSEGEFETFVDRLMSE
jgi:hypothetical protein